MAYQIERCQQPLLCRVVVEDGFQFPDFDAKLLKFASQLAVFSDRCPVFHIVCDASGYVRLFGELVLFEA